MTPERTDEERERDDMAAIQAGIDAMEAGDVMTLDELDARIRAILEDAPHED